MPMTRITIRVPLGITTLLDQLVEKENARHKKKNPHAISLPHTRSTIAREAMERGLYHMGVAALKRTTSDVVCQCFLCSVGYPTKPEKNENSIP